MHTTTEKQAELEDIPEGTVLREEVPTRVASTGRFAKGRSGNKKGRPKGALGKVNLVRQAVLADTEGLILTNAKKVVEVVIKQAIGGCRTSQRLILDRIVPAKKAVEVEGQKGDKAPIIKIVVENLITEPKQIDVVEGTFEEIEDTE